MIAGPKKFDAIAIKETLAIPTDGAIPGTLIAAKLKAGKKGPIHRPVIINAIQRITAPANGLLADNGTPITKPTAIDTPAM